MSSESQTVPYCQHVSPKGRRCHMLLDPNSASANGNAHPSLCAYHANRSNVSVATPDPETIAADLLRGIKNFSSPNSVNRFLGHLVKQLGRKRIARRDSVALAYISQLLLNTFPAMQREKDFAADHMGLSKELFGGILEAGKAALQAKQSAEPVAMAGRSPWSAPPGGNGRE
jgi:hypothetical protein